MQTLEKSKATQTTTSNQFRLSKSVKWTAELFEFQRVDFATENLRRMRTQQKSQEILNQSYQISNQYRMCDVLKMDRGTLQISKGHFFLPKMPKRNRPPTLKLRMPQTKDCCIVCVCELPACNNSMAPGDFVRLDS